MNRLLTLATTGLFVAGLAILPVSVYAQPNGTVGTTGTEMKADAKTGSAAVVSHDSKTAKPASVATGTTKAAPVAHDAKTTAPMGKEAGKDKAAVKDATPAPSGNTKVSTAPATTAPVKAGG